MKLQPDRIDVPAITAYGADWVAIQGRQQRSSVVLASTGEQFDWPCSDFTDLTPEHFDALLALPIEILILGTGAQQRFVRPSWLSGFMQRRMGVESMANDAACRTYNILASEGRRVAIALILPGGAPEPVSAPEA